MKAVKKIRPTTDNTDKKNIFVTNGIFQVYKKRAGWMFSSWFLGVGLILPLLGNTPEANLGIPPEKIQEKPYLSAFAPKFAGSDSLWLSCPPADSDKTIYTIQLCTFDNPLEDPILRNNPVIHLIRIGDLYRYIYAYFTTLDQARRQLVAVRLIFPQACIREYRKGKLGQVVDMKINY